MSFLGRKQRRHVRHKSARAPLCSSCKTNQQVIQTTREKRGLGWSCKRCGRYLRRVTEHD